MNTVGHLNQGLVLSNSENKDEKEAFSQGKDGWD